MWFSVFCPFYHVSLIFPCTWLMIVSKNGLTDRGIGSVGSAWRKMWRTRGYLITFLWCLLIETTTDTNIFKYFYCILFVWFFFCFLFFYFLPFFHIIMKSCFSLSTSKFREISLFSVSRKIYIKRYGMVFKLIQIATGYMYLNKILSIFRLCIQLKNHVNVV